MKTAYIKWHNALIWFGLATIIIWAISGISHPLMAWFGPQAVKMFPPSLTIKTDDALAVQTIIKQHALSDVAIAKIVPTADGAMLQLTETAGSEQTVNRRYFSLASQQEMSAYDEQQARWLAAYYSGQDISDVGQVTLINEFSHQYPWVNRLLPVYRVEMTGDEGLAVYVYTETNALASLNNNTKQTVQGLFQTLHTWSFLDFAGFGRILLIGLLMLTLVAMAVTGLMLVISIARRPIKDTSRRWHRSLAYALWLPMLAWPASGFYHLVQGHYVDSVTGIRLGDAVDLKQWLNKTTTDATWQQQFSDAIDQADNLNAVSLVKSNEEYFYRLSLAPKADEPMTRQARYDGRASESGVRYIDSHTGQLSEHTDQDQAVSLLHNLLGQDTTYNNLTLVTHFGPGYDFRNKRLPVWQIDLDDAEQTHIFVDPVTSILVDQNRSVDRLESLSFSLLHKWNHLFPLIGRQWRDVLIVITLFACLVLAGLGLQMHLRRKANVKA